MNTRNVNTASNGIVTMQFVSELTESCIVMEWVGCLRVYQTRS